MEQKDLLDALIAESTISRNELEKEAREAIKEVARNLWIKTFGGVEGIEWENILFKLMIEEIDTSEWIPGEQNPLNAAINALQTVEDIACRASKMLDTWLREKTGHGCRADNHPDCKS